jgi:methylmalonyl-CoA/ethylmalonyl-CoA epimerase
LLRHEEGSQFTGNRKGFIVTANGSPEVVQNRNCGENLLRFHHVGIVVESIKESAPRYTRFFGLQPVSEVVTDDKQRVNVQFLACEAEGTNVELIEPLPGSSPARRALENGGGLNHLCFEVVNIDDYVRHAQSEGVVCVCPPVPAAAFPGRRIAFLFYRGIGLIEFVEAASR